MIVGSAYLEEHSVRQVMDVQLPLREGSVRGLCGSRLAVRKPPSRAAAPLCHSATRHKPCSAPRRGAAGARALQACVRAQQSSESLQSIGTTSQATAMKHSGR